MIEYDILIIGAGVVGSSIARELSRYDVKLCVLEKHADVCYGNSGRNTGLLHAGFMYKPGSLKARFCVEGNAQYDALANELDIPVRRTGKLTVGNTKEEYGRLEQLIERGTQNGVPNIVMLDKQGLNKMEPFIEGEFAMLSKTSAIINPYLNTIALAENAAQNGAEYHFEQEVTGARKMAGGGYIVKTKNTEYKAKWVINSAGLYAPEVAALFGYENFRLRKVRAEYVLLDKKASDYLSMPVYPAPDENWVYDVHVTPTMEGNILMGPTCDEIIPQTNFDTTQRGLNLVAKNGKQIFPSLQPNWHIRSFSGLFPQAVDPDTGIEQDFIIHHPEEETLINLVGINSPGLTSAYPLAKEVCRLLTKKEPLPLNQNFNPKRKGILSFAEQPKERQKELVSQNPDYGEIICRCECITKAEILEALHNPLGVHSVQGIKYRTRATMGRCQGGYCETRIAAIIEEELGVSVTEVHLGDKEAYMFTGKVRQE